MPLLVASPRVALRITSLSKLTAWRIVLGAVLSDDSVPPHTVREGPQPIALLVMLPAETTGSTPIWSVPAFKAVLPLYVLLPLSVSTPEPFWIKPPVPDNTLETVAVPCDWTVSV